jgi:hypothetical protein
MMFPPTPQNLELMQKADAQKEKLARIGKNLEGGLIFKTTSANVMYIPVGCIHTVFTTHGGFLLTMEFNTPLAGPVLSRLFNYDFDKFKEDYAHAELPTQFIEAIKLALKQNYPLVGLKAWIDTEEHIRRWADNSTAMKYEGWNERRGDWKRLVDRMWIDFFADRESKKIACPCGRMGHGESLREHFRAAHTFTKGKPKTKTAVKEAQKPVTVNRPKRKRAGSNSPTRASQEDTPGTQTGLEEMGSENTSGRVRSNAMKPNASAQPSKSQDDPPTVRLFGNSGSEDVVEARRVRVKVKKPSRLHHTSKSQEDTPTIGMGLEDNFGRV